MEYKKALKAAFPYTIPVIANVFLGMAYGILVYSKGYGFLWAGLMSLTIYAGAMQFVTANLLTGTFDLVGAAFITLMLNARHIFYGFSMLEKFREIKPLKKFYMIYTLSDEAFALHCSAKPPLDVHPDKFHACLGFLPQVYWIGGSLLGGLMGAVLPFNSTGIDFVMTALFVVAFTEQMREAPNRVPNLIGLAGSGLCLLIFGPQNFILPSMLLVICALTVFRAPIERQVTQP